MIDDYCVVAAGHVAACLRLDRFVVGTVAVHVRGGAGMMVAYCLFVGDSTGRGDIRTGLDFLFASVVDDDVAADVGHGEV